MPAAALIDMRLTHGTARPRHGEKGTPHGVYIGPRRKFKGHGALVLPSREPGKVCVQFDAIGLTHRHRAMWAGWHKFPAKDWRVD
jgi:hypothetical protein